MTRTPFGLVDALVAIGAAAAIAGCVTAYAALEDPPARARVPLAELTDARIVFVTADDEVDAVIAGLAKQVTP